MPKPRTLLYVLALVLLVAACSGSRSTSSDQAKQPGTLTLGLFPPEAEQWSVYIAKDQGIFSKNGLDVQPVVVQDTTKLGQALVAGSLDVAMLTPDTVLRAAAQGKSDMILIGALVNTPSVPLVTARDITRAEQLKGKTIGVSSLTASDTLFARELLKKAGLGDKDYDLVQVGGSPDRLAALTNGAIQGTILSHPYDFRAQSQGFHLVASNTDVVPNYVWVAIATTRKYAEANPDALKNLMSSLKQATEWFYDGANRDQAVSVLMKEVSVDQKVADLAYTFFQEKKVISPDMTLDLEGFQVVTDFVESTGQIDRSKLPSLEDFVDASFANGS